jgi:hypothetical protein
MPPRIAINEAFIREVMTALTAIADEIPRIKGGGAGSTSTQVLDSLAVRPGGDGFSPGYDLRTTVNTRGKELAQKLDTAGVQMDQFVAGLRSLLAHTDNIEALNNMSVAEFERYVHLTPPTPPPTP